MTQLTLTFLRDSGGTYRCTVSDHRDDDHGYFFHKGAWYSEHATRRASPALRAAITQAWLDLLATIILAGERSQDAWKIEPGAPALLARKQVEVET